MRKNKINILILVAVLISVTLNQSYAQQSNTAAVEIDTTGTLVFPFEDEGEFQYPNEIENKPLYLKQPANIDRKVVYDPETQQYIIYEKVGDFYYRLPKSMNLREYVQYDFDQSIKEYWRTRKETESIEVETGGLIPQLRIESEAFSSIFGSEIIDIRPQGYVEVQFGVESNYIADESLPERLRRATLFDFENQINISVNGKIGDKVDMDFNFNTEATFDFENKMNIEYSGKEDEILRRIEAGNVSLPLNGSLIQGGTNLFGVKTEMQFGKLDVTTVISQHKGESQVIETEGGAQKTSFEISASDYDENRHFFISKYFRDNYNSALSMLPVIRSQVVVNKIEVWVTNKNQDFTSSRDIVAFVDLGEIDNNLTNTVAEFASNGANNPSNGANGMYAALSNNYAGIRNSAMVNNTLESIGSNFVAGTDWAKIDQARKLSESEYSFNSQLGFISLNSPLNNDEVLAVAYQYVLGGNNYTVGEFTSSSVPSDESLILKLIKGVTLSPESPTWDLMMKNVYNLGAYGLTSDDFEFQVLYHNDSTNTYINNLPEGELQDTILLRLMNLDNLDSQSDYAPNGDGVFDYLENISVISQTGRIIFPILEPFGANISDNLSSPELKEKYAFNKIYTHSKTDAEQDFSHDKYAMIGSYKGSSGSEISLNSFNLVQGSVVVTAGGRQLEEDIDYVVDYAMGKVKVINEGLIEAGTPIQVSTESQELISTQRKTMIGSYANYNFSEKLNIGGTMLYMNERPITNKVEMGEEPVTNLMLGLDFQYRDRSKLLTDIVNVLPFYDSDVESSISVEGEVAKLITGSSSSTGDQIYIDDFEGVETSYSFLSVYGWSMASTPQGQSDLFPEASSNQLDYGFNRAKLAWYYIDRDVFNYQSSSTMPAYLKNNPSLRANHYTRSVLVKEIFPGKELALGTPDYMAVLNLAFYPKEKGPYNFDSEAIAGVSAGVDENNNLEEPDTRWGGIMREVTTSNFESSNVEFIEFWVLDPFIYNKDTEGGDLYINLGNVSEDVLKDSRKAFENGLPSSELVENVDTTIWGRVSTQNQLGIGFDNEADSRGYQDIGLDGLSNDDEASFFADYLARMQNILSTNAYQKVVADPANDDFKYYRSTAFDEAEASILERYKNYNNPQNNSPTQAMSSEAYTTASKNIPDIEDINSDNTLSENESYYQYKVSMRPEDMVVGKNFIVDKVTTFQIPMADQTTDTVHWYQFKIPVKDSTAWDKKVGDIYGFKSIRFMRMFLTNFSDSINLRFGTLNLVRSDWRKESYSLVESGSNESANAIFEVTSINIEENGNRTPINYILPPDIEREQDPSSPTLIEMNEQSMLLKVKDLEPGDAKAVYKDVGIDLRQYKRLKMEVHAEMIDGYPIEDNELSVFIRMGTDINNYYEYEIPLSITPEPLTTYSDDDSDDREIVWPEDNRLNVKLSKFTDLKLQRNAAVRAAGSTLSASDIYSDIDVESIDSKNIIRIKGNPSLGEVDVVHIGIRNPNDNENGPKSIEVWVNELRVSDFESSGGWASSGRVSLRLADLGSLSLSGSTQSVGWGSISEAASQRSLDNKYQYSIAATAELGKLVPEAIGLNLPLFYSVTKSVASPEFNPLSSDIKMNDAIALIDDPVEKSELLQISQDVVTRKSFNLNNISFDPISKKKDRKQLPTDIKNFSVSYAKNEQVSHDIDVQNYIQRTQKGVFNYNYSVRSKPITPLKKVPFLKPKIFTLIRDFNFSLLPEMVSFRTDLSRSYNERTARDNSGLNIEMPTTVQKDLLWNRYFDFRYNLTSALKIDFTNHSVSRIDELDGVINKELYPDEYALMMDEIYKNIASFGRPTDYQHTLTVNYRVPINKLPLLDFTSATVNYKGSYDWMGGPILSQVGDDSFEVGNTVGNNMNLRVNGNLNLLTLYNKVPYFKEVNSRFKSSRRTYGSRSKNSQSKQRKPDTGEPKKTKEVNYNDKNVSFRVGVPKSIFHRLGTEDVVVTVLNEKGDTIAGEVTIVDNNRINFNAEVGVRSGIVRIIGTKEIDELFIEKALAFSTRILLGIRTARITYNQTGATQLPGFLPEPYLFGMRNDATTGSKLAPTIPFLLGWQNSDFALQAAENDWITTDNSIQKQFMIQNSEAWNFALQLEPIANIKIDLTANRRESRNTSSIINYNEESVFELLNGVETGNFDMSILTLKTMFTDKISGDEEYSVVFDKFRNENRQIISDRLNEQRGWNDETGYSKFGGNMIKDNSLNSTDVIIPAFLAAYTGTDPHLIPLTARPSMSWIRPNWRINYNGNPQSIAWMKDIISTLNFNHSYKSTYSIGSFETNLDYDPDENGLSWTRDDYDQTTFVPELAITSINIQETFSPLINVDIGFVNDLSTRFEIRRTRNLNFDFTANQLNEMIKNEYSVGVGYRFTGMDMIIKTRKKSEEVSNDVNLRLDITGSNYKNVLRQIGDDDERPVGVLNGGAKIYSMDFQADYMVSDKLNVKLYYQFSINNPHNTMNGFSRSNTKFGLSFNFSIM